MGIQWYSYSLCNDELRSYQEFPCHILVQHHWIEWAPWLVSSSLQDAWSLLVTAFIRHFQDKQLIMFIEMFASSNFSFPGPLPSFTYFIGLFRTMNDHNT